MARTNIARAGFQFWKPADGQTGLMQPIECVLNTSKPDTYDLYPGDCVKLVVGAGGATANAAAAAVNIATEGEHIFGVVADIVQYKRSSDGVVVRNGCKYLPADTTWTNWAERSLIAVWPAQSCLFTVDANAAKTYATDPYSLVGLNVPMLTTAAAAALANQGLGLSGQAIAIASAANTNSLSWRIVGVTDEVGNDPSLVTARYIVRANLCNMTGVPVGSTTGIS